MRHSLKIDSRMLAAYKLLTLKHRLFSLSFIKSALQRYGMCRPVDFSRVGAAPARAYAGRNRRRAALAA